MMQFHLAVAAREPHPVSTSGRRAPRRTYSTPPVEAVCGVWPWFPLNPRQLRAPPRVARSQCDEYRFSSARLDPITAPGKRVSHRFPYATHPISWKAAMGKRPPRPARLWLAQTPLVQARSMKKRNPTRRKARPATSSGLPRMNAGSWSHLIIHSSPHFRQRARNQIPPLCPSNTKSPPSGIGLGPEDSTENFA